MDEFYLGHRIKIERPQLPQFTSGPLRGGAAQTWKISVDGRDVSRHTVKRKMDSMEDALAAARKYVDRLGERPAAEA
ncbi:hypothetical protein EHF33_02820 [Deinococcus psychrotolerans]|uniref:Uncharacterized protein n=2 Tax=Deinococcus TaxID=1298 RepID=A0A553UZM6_9DEIO|nr:MULTISPECIES: hypothetical protein [Deinococcus]AZI41811.1 hypothetical protein EHF33_02820 [Deinococcus psychrotolerans]TSA85662.1 hypothetical protein FNU79_09420 [Deinococcus detaillensis]